MFESCRGQSADLLCKSTDSFYNMGTFALQISGTLDVKRLMRLILNLKNLDKNLTYKFFKMEAFELTLALVQPNSCLVTIDLKDVYYSLKIYENVIS